MSLCDILCREMCQPVNQSVRMFKQPKQ